MSLFSFMSHYRVCQDIFNKRVYSSKKTFFVFVDRIKAFRKSFPTNSVVAHEQNQSVTDLPDQLCSYL